MSTVKTISDKLQLALGFFFILEINEQLYNTFLQPFDVFDEEDFVFNAHEEINIEDEKEAEKELADEKEEENKKKQRKRIDR